MRNLSERLVKGSLWITASRGLVNFLGFVSTIVLARLLVPADFGLVALGTTMLAIVNAVTNLSLSQALVHHRNPTDDHFHAAWTMGAARGLLIGLLFSAAAIPASRFYGDPRLAGVMHALGFSVFLSGLVNPRRIMLQKDLVFWQDFVLNVSQKLIGVVVSVAIALIWRNYWALVLGTIAGQVANVLISYTVLPFRPRPVLKHLRELWSFSAWLTMSQVINTINWRFDQLLIGKFLGKADLGYYTVGSNLALLPTREATLPLTQTLFPAFSRLADDPERLRKAYQRAQAMVTAIALPAGVGVALVARPLVELAMSPKWLPAVAVIQALASVFALQTLGTLSQPLGMALGRTRLLFTRDTQLFFIRLPFIIAGMYLYGLQGMVLARVLTGTLAIGANLMIVRKLIGLSILEQLGANVRSLVSIATMAAGVLVLRNQFHDSPTKLGLLGEVVSAAALGAVIYFGTTMALWLLMRRPAGPETEFMRGFAIARSKFGAKSPASQPGGL